MIHDLECYVDKKLMQVTGLADPVPAAAVLAEPTPGCGRRCAGEGEQDYGSYEIQMVEAIGAETGGRVGGHRRRMEG